MNQSRDEEPDHDVEQAVFRQAYREARIRRILDAGTPLDPPVWSDWSGFMSMKLWEIVALSLNFSPVAERRYRVELADPHSPVEEMKGWVRANGFEPQRRVDDPDHEYLRVELLERLLDNERFAKRLVHAASSVGQEGGPCEVGDIQGGPDHARIVDCYSFAWFVAENGLDIPSQFPWRIDPAETDPRRRLALLRRLGGNARWDDANGKFVFSRSDLLVDQERRDGRPRSDPKTIRADLAKAAERERELHRQGDPGVGRKDQIADAFHRMQP